MGEKCLLIDFGNVLYEIDFTKTVRALESLCFDNVTIDFSAKSQLELFNQLEIGALTPIEFLQTFHQMYCKESTTHQQIIDAWNELFIAPFLESEEVISQLKEAGYTLALVSNTNQIHVDYFYPKSQSFLKYFDYIFFSHQIKRRKPNKEFFEYVLTEMNIYPHQAIFIDDSPQHLVTANSLGISSYLKNNNITLSELFHTVNIL